MNILWGCFELAFNKMPHFISVNIRLGTKRSLLFVLLEASLVDGPVDGIEITIIFCCVGGSVVDPGQEQLAMGATTGYGPGSASRILSEFTLDCATPLF